MDHGGDGFYRGPGGGGGGGMDAYALPTAPNRDRREEEEHGGAERVSWAGRSASTVGTEASEVEEEIEIEDRYDCEEARGTIGEAIEAIDTGTERIDTGTEKETGTIEEIIIEDEETTIATLTRMERTKTRAGTESRGYRDWSKRTALRKERKGEAALETVMAQIADTTIEAIANLVGRVARTLAIGLNERA